MKNGKSAQMTLLLVLSALAQTGAAAPSTASWTALRIDKDFYSSQDIDSASEMRGFTLSSREYLSATCKSAEEYRQKKNDFLSRSFEGTLRDFAWNHLLEKAGVKKGLVVYAEELDDQVRQAKQAAIAPYIAKAQRALMGPIVDDEEKYVGHRLSDAEVAQLALSHLRNYETEAQARELMGLDLLHGAFKFEIPETSRVLNATQLSTLGKRAFHLWEVMKTNELTERIRDRFSASALKELAEPSTSSDPSAAPLPKYAYEVNPGYIQLKSFYDKLHDRYQPPQAGTTVSERKAFLEDPKNNDLLLITQPARADIAKIIVRIPPLGDYQDQDQAPTLLSERLKQVMDAVDSVTGDKAGKTMLGDLATAQSLASKPMDELSAKKESAGQAYFKTNEKSQFLLFRLYDMAILLKQNPGLPLSYIQSGELLNRYLKQVRSALQKPGRFTGEAERSTPFNEIIGREARDQGALLYKEFEATHRASAAQVDLLNKFLALSSWNIDEAAERQSQKLASKLLEDLVDRLARCNQNIECAYAGFKQAYPLEVLREDAGWVSAFDERQTLSGFAFPDGAYASSDQSGRTGFVYARYSEGKENPRISPDAEIFVLRQKQPETVLSFYSKDGNSQVQDALRYRLKITELNRKIGPARRKLLEDHAVQISLVPGTILNPGEAVDFMLKEGKYSIVESGQLSNN